MLTILDRETERPVWSKQFDNFAEANTCAAAFNKLYEQGLEHGRQKALEEIRRTITHIERGPL
jgi:hypothetical protein